MKRPVAASRIMDCAKTPTASTPAPSSPNTALTDSTPLAGITPLRKLLSGAPTAKGPSHRRPVIGMRGLPERACSRALSLRRRALHGLELCCEVAAAYSVI